MIKKLRIKIICVIMTIVMLMMGGILGVIIHFTAESMEAESISMMRQLLNKPFHDDLHGKRPPNEVRLPYFAVIIDRQGELYIDNNSHYDLSDETHIRDIVDTVLLSGDEIGQLKELNLRYLKDDKPYGVVIIFSDMATERTTINNLFWTCLLIFVASGPVFLGISILLSGWVIRPVEKAWEQQRQFVADASHELKTPLAVIMANAELIQNEDASDEERKTFSQNILTMTYQMRSLVTNMLEMARVDNGTQKMKFGPVDFGQLVNDAALSFQLLYEEKGLDLQCTAPEEIKLTGSEQHLYQVLDVLLDNALKYSAIPGAVRVNLTKIGCVCSLSVASPGEPIPKDELKNIFKRFYRIDKARTVNGCYGLGLSIAQSIVEAHKGKIWAESTEGYNTFHVQLPLHGCFHSS